MKIVCVFAHPDDESFFAGGTIAKLAQEGHTVVLVTATRGEKGSVGNPPLCTQEDLGKVREKELRNAAKVLGITKIIFLDYIDGTLITIPFTELDNKILVIFEAENPDIVITFNKEGGSRHPDHIQISKATTEAFYAYAKTQHVTSLYYMEVPREYLKKLEDGGTLYNAFGKIEGTKEKDITTVVDISDTIEEKIKAFECHKTQENDWKFLLKGKNYPEFTQEFFTLIVGNNLI